MECAANSESGFIGLWVRSRAGLFAGECGGGKERSLVVLAHWNGIISSPLYEELSTNIVGGETRITKEVSCTAFKLYVSGGLEAHPTRV